MPWDLRRSCHHRRDLAEIPTNLWISRSPHSSSGPHKSAEGCTVASVSVANADGISRPRSQVTRNALPNKACAAVVPSARMIRGAIATISALSHGKQGLDHHLSRLIVNAPRSARHPFEMFDNVGDVGPRTIDAGLGEAAVEQLSCPHNAQAVQWGAASRRPAIVGAWRGGSCPPRGREFGGCVVIFT